MLKGWEGSDMSSKDKTLQELKKKLGHIDAWLNDLYENEKLPEDAWPLWREFTISQGKHIPPELCTEIKLWERIDELDKLVDEINEKLENTTQ